MFRADDTTQWGPTVRPDAVPASARTDDAILPIVRFRPDASTPAGRFDQYRDIVRYYDPGYPEPDALPRFDADASFWHLGGVVVCGIRYAARPVGSRSQRQIRTDQLDHYRLIVQHEGAFRFDADGRQGLVGPGQVLILDMARPERIDGETGRNTIVYLPREVLDEALPRPVDLHGLALGGISQLLLADHLGSVMRHVAQLTPSQGVALSRSVVAMIAGAIAPSIDTLAPVRRQVEATLLRQACRYVELHLDEPDLNADRVAAFLRISRASVYRLFEPLGGVSAHVRERRLQRLHEVLATSGQHRHLGRLATDHGFSSAAQFSRVFRERFGYTPSDAQGRVLVPQAGLAPASGAGADMVDWLRGLQG